MIEAAENEGLVLDDGSARGESVLVAPRRGKAPLKLRSRGHRIVGVKLRERPVILVRAGLGEHLHQRPAVASLLGREGIRRHTDLLYGVGLRSQVGDTVA